MLSVCVPTTGRPSLAAALASIEVARRAARGPVEVVVADASGRAEALVGGGARLVANPAGTASAARNLAAAATSGELLLFVDDDCRLAPGHLAALEVRAAAEPDFEAWAGRTHRDPGDDPLQRAWHELFDWPYAAAERHAWLRWAPSTNFAVRRRTFEALGGFAALPQPVGGEDTDLCLRLVAAGLGPIRAAPELVAHHAAEEPGRLLDKAFRYGAAVQGVMERHAPRTRPVPPGPVLHARTPASRLLAAYARGARSLHSPPRRPLPGPAADLLDDVDDRLRLAECPGGSAQAARERLAAAGHLVLAAAGDELLVYRRGVAGWGAAALPGGARLRTAAREELRRIADRAAQGGPTELR